MAFEFLKSITPILPRSAPVSNYSTNPDRLLKLAQQAEYVHEVWWFMASVIGALAMFHYSSLLLRACSRWSEPPSDNGIVSDEPPSRKSGKISLRRLPIAISSSFRIILFRWTVPIGTNAVMSIAELLYVFGYIGGLLMWEFMHTKDLETYLWEDRAAHLASCQIPLVVALAGKNNIISFLTGVSHEQLNVLHRAAGRTLLLLLWVHAMARHATGLTGHFSLENGWMRSGVLGLTALSLAFFLSLRPIRHVAFEFFLLAHIILIAIFIICGFMHAREPGFGSYFWPGLIVWCFDRLVRFLRIVFLNRIWLGSRSTRASVEMLSPDTVRLTLRRHMSWKPGQHIYLNMPGISTFPGELHPFTIASVPANNGEQDSKVVCVIKARNGLTKRLRDYALKNSEPISVLVDGPYGCPPDFSTSNTAILIAGGSGITFILPLLTDIVRRARENRAATKRVLWVWTVRDAVHIQWIQTALDDISSKLPQNIIVDAQIYVTRPTRSHSEVFKGGDLDIPSSISMDEKDSTAFDSQPNFPCYQVKEGRPNIKALLEEAIALSEDSVAVGVAGPPQLAQAVRGCLGFNSSAKPSAVLKGGPLITLHTETFGTVRG